MTIGENAPEYDMGADMRRLADAGYTVKVQRWEHETGGGDYFAEITSGMGSTWQGFGGTPADAVRGVWPLGQGPGRGGCAHCGGIGCEAEGCTVCGAYTDRPGNGVCAVCGEGYPFDGDPDDDDLEPYCRTCGEPVSIFYGHGDAWSHFRTVARRHELYDPGHAAAVAWRYPDGDEGQDNEDGPVTRVVGLGPGDIVGGRLPFPGECDAEGLEPGMPVLTVRRAGQDGEELYPAASTRAAGTPASEGGNS
jgi:hypothetical protein